MQSTSEELANSNPWKASDGSVTPSPFTAQQPAISATKKETPSPRKSKKVLKLNGAGGFGTPGSKAKAEGLDTAQVKSPKRGRPKKQKASLVVRIKYGTNDGSLREEVARKIEAILEAPVVAAAPQDIPPAPKPAVNPSKPAHPFFLGKPGATRKSARNSKSMEANATEVRSQHRPTISASTPGKLRRRIVAQPRAVSPDDKLPIEPKSERIFRLPGIFDAAFPPRGLQRVSPPATAARSLTPDVSSPRAFHKNRRKAHAATVNFEESFLNRFTRTLTHTLPLAPGSEASRVQRAVISGDALRTRVAEALSVAGFEQTFLSHPSLRKLADEIFAKRSAFDQGRCERETWSAKYNPKTATEVLQSEREVNILQAWLQSQVVASTRVDPLVASTLSNVKGSKDSMPKRRKKRRKPNEELDDFLVDDDEAASLRDVSDDEGSVTGVVPAMRSLIQDSTGQLSDSKRKTNAVLISGPHGCGKSAAVYAVAKELGFDVFEIGPNTRRSGKDILEKVGDMARYHQVSRAKSTGIAVSAEPSSWEEEADALPRERSQDQSSLNSFFVKSQSARPQPKPKQMKPAKSTSKPPTQNRTLSKAPPQQRQSVILLEEVDILFEQDKQFWETVLEFARGSRRPIIMTCNDETLVPLNELSLHAILRFRSPPLGPATQYLTLLAAAEGHLVDPHSIKTLLQLKGHDLRASITQLQFWCQMGLGDTKGGLSWYLSQWPPGANQDGHGQSLRVVSKSTFQQDLELPLERQSTTSAVNDATIQEAWHDWSLDASDVSSSAIEERCHREARADASLTARHESLRELDAYTELLSAADMACRVHLPHRTGSGQPGRDPLDPEQPPLPSTIRAEHIEGHHLIDGQRMLDHTGKGTQIACFMHAGVMSLCGITSSSGLIRRIVLEKTQTEGPAHTQAILKNKISTSLEPMTDPLFEHGICPASIQDIAPYVRSIASFDLALERQRSEMAGIGRKMRSTRASRSALEGSQRSKTRRERWFSKETDLRGLLATGGHAWPRPLAPSAPTSHGSPEPSSREASAGL